jgi:uncharacterized Zn finger protein (UPF0148 family)
MVTDTTKPTCPKCGRKTIYFRKDGSVRCTACGYDGKAEVKK